MCRTCATLAWLECGGEQAVGGTWWAADLHGEESLAAHRADDDERDESEADGTNLLVAAPTHQHQPQQPQHYGHKEAKARDAPDQYMGCFEAQVSAVGP